MDLDRIEAVIKEAMALARTKPGLYGGRYVARKYDAKNKKDIYFVMETDDPDSKEAKNPKADILCHAQANKVYGIGFARNWINLDGTLDREHLRPKAKGGPS